MLFTKRLFKRRFKKTTCRSDGRKLGTDNSSLVFIFLDKTLFFCFSQISLACVFEDKNLSVFRSLRTLRALRPLRAISRMEGMKVTDAEFICCIYIFILRQPNQWPTRTLSYRSAPPRAHHIDGHYVIVLKP